ncbi:MAG: MarR family transcriptional regulator [Eubacterium sp.]|nr:MarR family transcriptional regulator [Eubacterium sp.]
MSDKKYDCLRLANQLCFPLYACSKEVIRRYKPYLDKVNLTYTQYIAMMVMWEQQKLSVKELGEYLYLDSGTLTPVLKKLEEKGYVTRARSHSDERMLEVEITAEGIALQDRCKEIPAQMGGCVALDADEADTLYKLLYKIIDNIKN